MLTKALKPSSWGMKAVDIIFALLVFAFIVKLISPTSGLGLAIHTLCNWLALGIQWAAKYLVQFLEWI